MSTTLTRRGRSCTPEEKEKFAEQRAETRARVNQLADTAMTALATSAQLWKTFLRAAAVHHQRPGTVNLLLLAVQAPEAEAVNSFQGWRAQGRQVRRGEKGHKIYTTVIKPRQGEAEPQHNDSEDQAADERGALAGFSVGTVFDIAQTDPIQGKDQPDLTSPYRISADQAAAAVRAQLARHGFRVEERPGAGAAHMDAREDGDDGMWILPLDPADATGPATTRELLGVLAHCEFLAANGGTDSRTLADEAESAAHLAALMLGLPTGPAPLPDIPEMSLDDPNNPPIKQAATAVVTIGRRIAADLSGRR
ncbi:MAG: hypothetical protein JO362_22040 [Streptomycetaceae bacterium]|nr:hypothetical protein [Streptomycetaceae bacterium]